MSGGYYQLKVGTFRLAQRASIIIDSEEIISHLKDATGSSTAACSSSGGSCSGQIKNKEIVLDVKFLSNGCDFAAADSLYRQLEAYLESVCNTNVITFQRRACNENYEEYQINAAYILRKEMENEGCNGYKSGEVHLITMELADVGIAVFSINGLPPN